MASARASLIPAIAALACCAAPGVASAFGPDGHRIAGLLAEPRLCAATRAEVAAIGGGQSLAELGVWADEVRRERRESAPWHYVNIADPAQGAAAAAVAAFRHPPEGDALEAIARFRTQLADRSRAAAERLDALRYLVHFVVDVHQPLHVGRADDRGGNDVDVRYGGTVVNLHRFWDTDVIALRGLSPRRYARMLAARVDAAAGSGGPLEWVAESLALRSTVYDFHGPNGSQPIVLDASYIARAQHVTDERLVRAGARLATTLNEIFCGG
ncbi:MAG TPA: S1/P1 nuclease [Gammaproteobacteria bacterium]|nr:S1/P1 nuclease [Gammaproteobacteria bacterium]